MIKIKIHPPQCRYARPPQWLCYGGWRGQVMITKRSLLAGFRGYKHEIELACSHRGQRECE